MNYNLLFFGLFFGSQATRRGGSSPWAMEAFVPMVAGMDGAFPCSISSENRLAFPKKNRWSRCDSSSSPKFAIEHGVQPVDRSIFQHISTEFCYFWFVFLVHSVFPESRDRQLTGNAVMAKCSTGWDWWRAIPRAYWKPSRMDLVVFLTGGSWGLTFWFLSVSENGECLLGKKCDKPSILGTRIFQTNPYAWDTPGIRPQ